MSTIEIDNNVVDFREYRRAKTIEAIIKFTDFPQEQIENLMKMHTFLTSIDHAERDGQVTEQTVKDIEEELQFVREKFEELFEMMKDQLFI
jgi:ABC-type taurine transport system substrate-binding protein